MAKGERAECPSITITTPRIIFPEARIRSRRLGPHDLAWSLVTIPQKRYQCQAVSSSKEPSQFGKLSSPVLFRKGSQRPQLSSLGIWMRHFRTESQPLTCQTWCHGVAPTSFQGVSHPFRVRRCYRWCASRDVKISFYDVQPALQVSQRTLSSFDSAGFQRDRRAQRNNI